MTKGLMSRIYKEKNFFKPHKYAITLKSRNCTCGHLFQRNETYAHTETCTQMFTAALFVTKTEKTHTFFHGWMIQQTAVYPYHRINNIYICICILSG